VEEGKKMNTLYAVRCTTPEIFKAIEAMAHSAGYAWPGGTGSGTVAGYACATYGNQVVIFLGEPDDYKRLSYGSVKNANDDGRVLLNPATEFERVVDVIYGVAHAPSFMAGKHKVKFSPDIMRVRVGCAMVSFDIVHKVHNATVRSGKQEPVRILCKNALLFRGVESMLLARGFMWNGSSDSSRLHDGGIDNVIVLVSEVADTPMHLMHASGTHDALDPETEMERLEKIIDRIKTGCDEEVVETPDGALRVDRAGRTVSRVDNHTEFITFDDVDRIHRVVEELEAKGK
jgi:hypothetical protein